MALKRIFAVLEENQENILKQWLAEIKKSSELGSLQRSASKETSLVTMQRAPLGAITS
jgi:hypothetical protein